MTSSVDQPLYVILREQEEYGPFFKETLQEAMEAGNLVPDDWVRKADRTSCWTSVEQLLYGPPEPVPPMVKIRRAARLGMASLLSVTNRAVEICAARLAKRAGLIACACIAVAAGIAFLPEQPWAISVPWMLAGVAAGVALILRRRVLHGAIACLAASLLPLAAFRTISVVHHYLDPNRRETALPPIGEMYSNMPRKGVELPKDRPRAKSGIPALGLPQPTDEGKQERRAPADGVLEAAKL